MTTRLTFRGDVHANISWFKSHFEQAQRSHSNMIDLGDPWAPYIGLDHPLREGQKRGQETKEVIASNGEKNPTLLHQTIDSVIAAIPEVANQIERIATQAMLKAYRGIKGNAEDAWLLISDIANRKEEMETAFKTAHEIPQQYWMQQADAEFFYDNRPLGISNNMRDVEIGVLYLPYKASVDSVRKAADTIHEVDPTHVCIALHDRVTVNGVPSEYMDIVRDGKNDEQIITALDILANGRDIQCVHGHIGPHVPEYTHTFMHNRRTIHVHHIDEASGKLHTYQP